MRLIWEQPPNQDHGPGQHKNGPQGGPDKIQHALEITPPVAIEDYTPGTSIIKIIKEVPGVGKDDGD